MIKNICILGTGAMGSRVATHFINQGFNISIYNRNKKNATELIKQGAHYFTTPARAVADADLVISMLTDDSAAKSVWLNSQNGALFAMKKASIAIESSTLSVNCISQLNSAFTKHNIAFLDAPVLGSRPQAEAATLIFLVGGNETVLSKVSHVLEKLSSAIHYIGKSGSGATMKLAVNAYFGTQVTALSEVIAALQKAGINKQQSVELFNQLPTTSPVLQGIGQLIASENFTAFFPIDLVEKDLSYMLNLAEQINTKVPTIIASHLSYKRAIDNGFAKDNIAGVAQMYL